MTTDQFTRIMAVMMDYDWFYANGRLIRDNEVPREWSPILDGELTHEVRKWLEGNTDWWEKYLYEEYVGDSMRGDTYADTLNAQLSASNFMDWLEKNDEWRANCVLPLREAYYQRQGKNRWVLVKTGRGFA